MKKQTKPFLFFTRNCESIKILICFNIIPVYNGNLKSGIKNGTEVTLKLSSNIAGDSNDSNNYPQVSKFCKAYANGPWANIKWSKAQLEKRVVFLDSLLGPILKKWLAFNRKFTYTIS